MRKIEVPQVSLVDHSLVMFLHCMARRILLNTLE
uniref:Uncharacterized protein n=1 Tax=Rhizophora mucronata TaxID=61149 RepID=A0A2P2QMW1_RHIMU